jgi:hypothetical protein
MEIQIEVEEARRRWPYLVHQVVTYGVRVVLLRNGRVIGALVGRADLEFLAHHRRGPVPSTGPPVVN